jgi:Protein of unknown function (DUF2950)
MMRGLKLGLRKLPPVRGPWALVALTGLALLAAVHADVSLAGTPDPQTFKSAEEAGNALFLAVKGHNEVALTRVLGAGSELVDSDDESQDRLDREQFVEKYRQMHRLARESNGRARLYIGAENWPFPVPLVSQNGRWHFDSEAGMREVQFRRIGENEIAAIRYSRSLVAAQTTAQPPSANRGTAEAGRVENTTEPFHGYYFRVVPDSHDRFAVVAYPAEYRSSGVMTFIADQAGEVREKDLGPDTAKIADAILAHYAQSTWNLADGSHDSSAAP